MSQAPGYVDPHYLQTAAQLLQPLKQRSYQLLQLNSGQRVLDVGCGPGIDTCAIAESVGPDGQVIGLDYDPEMVVLAQQRARQHNYVDRVEHLTGSATALPFNDDYFDSCRSDRLFMHLAQPVTAAAEMVRVTKPGGRVLIADVDCHSISIDSSEIDIERRLMRFATEQILLNQHSGRRLYRWLKQQRLTDLQIEVFPIHTTDYGLARYLARLEAIEQQALVKDKISASELQRWQDDLQQAAGEEVFFACFNVIMVLGQKPV